MEKIAIYGGSFDPVHIEHVRLANLAVEKLELDRLIVMPTYLSPHKNSCLTSAQDRLNMLKLAFADNPKVTVSDYEINNGGTSYTYLTVEHFAKQVNGKLYFIVGADMLKDFKTWKYPQRILCACTLACFGRSQSDCDFKREKEYFKNTFSASFEQIDYVGREISSTRARVYNWLGLDITAITGEKVFEYIKKNQLYKGDKYAEFIKKSLPEKRLKHTANVILTALCKAKELGLDKQKVILSAMLHDCAKYIDYKRVKGFVLPKGVPAPVVHSYLGEYIARNVLGVTDSDVLDAICYHTSGKPNMSTLAKLIFVADMIEEGRDYLGVEKLRELYYQGDFENCFIECLKEEVLHLLNKKEYVYKLTLDAYDYYVKGDKGEKI